MKIILKKKKKKKMKVFFQDLNFFKIYKDILYIK